MPLALDPEETFEVVLPSDRPKPKGRRPTFRFRHPTARTARRLRQILRLPAEEFAADAEALIAEIWRILQEHCVGWRRMRMPSTSAPLSTGESPRRSARANRPRPPSRTGKRRAAAGAEIPFVAGSLDVVLAEQEIWSLAVAVLAGAAPTEAEKKGPGSPSPSDTGASAPDAAAADA